MKQDAYERTLKARAFDLSRYLLPLATNTSLGQIVSARTLENQVSRLLSHTHAEVRRLGELLKQAAREDSYNVNRKAASRVGWSRSGASVRRWPSAREQFLSARGAGGSDVDEVRRAERVRSWRRDGT